MSLDSNNIYEAFFNNSTEGIIIFNTTGKIINANSKACKVFGCDIKELGQKYINDVIEEKYQDTFWKKCNILLTEKGESSQTQSMVIREHKQHGKQVVLGIYLNNHIRSKDESLLAAVVRDETQEWKNRLELQQSQERFRKSFHNNLVGQLIVSAGDQKIIDVNSKFLNLSGYGRAEVLTKNITTVGLNPCNCNTPAKTIRTTLQKAGEQCEAVLSVKNGKQVSILQSYDVIKVHNIPHELWTITDLTKIKEAEKRLKRMNEELESKVQARTKDLAEMLEREKRTSELKTRFVSTASHEFRTPLTTILASTGLVEKYIDLNKTSNCAKHIERIKGSVKMLTEILEEFLSLDKIEQGIIKPNVMLFELKDFVEGLIEETEATLKKGQVISYALDGDPLLKQDRNILKSILLNLVSNASKYSGEGGKIDLSISANGDKVVIAVGDNGMGIPIDEQGFIFSRFFRAKNAEGIQGTGLGLNIVKKYVELLKGKISFVSSEQQGTTFIVELPSLAK